MSRITPIEIENIEFKRTLFGLNKGNVDAFLEEVLLSYEEMYKENISLKDKINNLNDVVVYYKDMEDTLKNTLLAAEKTGEDIVEVAKKNAEQIENEAYVTARNIVGEAESEVRRLNIKREKLLASYDSLRTKMYEYLKTQMALTLEEDDNVLSKVEERIA